MRVNSEAVQKVSDQIGSVHTGRMLTILSGSLDEELAYESKYIEHRDVFACSMSKLHLCHCVIRQSLPLIAQPSAFIIHDHRQAHAI